MLIDTFTEMISVTSGNEFWEFGEMGDCPRILRASRQSSIIATLGVGFLVMLALRQHIKQKIRKKPFTKVCVVELEV